MLLRRVGGGADAGGAWISFMLRDECRTGGADDDGEEPKTYEWRRRADGDNSPACSGGTTSNEDEEVRESDLRPSRALGDGDGEGVGSSPLA